MNQKQRVKLENDIKVLEWVRDVTSSRAKLLTVPLNIRKEAVTVDALAAGTGLPPMTAYSRLDKTTPVINAMVAENIIVPGELPVACEWRRRLLNWYERMSDEEKQAIPISGGKIKKGEYLSKIPELDGYVIAVIKYPLARQTFDEILDDFRQRGVISSEYMTVKQRAEAKAVEMKVTVPKVKVDFEELRKITLSSVADLVESSTEKPFRPLLHLFASASTRAKTESGQGNYYEAWRFMCKFFVTQGSKGGEELEALLGVYLLRKFRVFMENIVLNQTCSTAHANTLMSSARIALKTAIELPGLGFSSFYAAPGFEVNRQTDSYTPYTSTERTRIGSAVLAEMDRIRGFLKPYEPTGLGIDPIGANGEILRGARTLENARWIFENKFGCKPIGYQGQNSGDAYQEAFVAIAFQSKVSLEQIYESWGVLYRRDSHILAPYVARLAQITGINLESLLSLDVDSFVAKSEVGGRPYLRYWKERSTGEKVYFMDLFEADISWLSVSQAKEVKTIFEDVISLTEDIRKDAAEKVGEKLFIYRYSSARFFGKINSLEDSAGPIVAQMLEKFVDVNSLRDDEGQPLKMLVPRFRPSLVSELIENNVPLRQIQLMLGHKHISTTLKYLDKLDFNKISRKVLDEKIRELHAKASSALEVAEPPVKRDIPSESAVIFKTPLAACRDVMNPPEFVKKLKSYDATKPCQLYNKCIACPNVILLKSNLPDLFAMQRDYLSTLELVPSMETPYFAVIRENLALLAKILDPVQSDFSSDDLEEGWRLSEYIETSVLVDGVIV